MCTDIGLTLNFAILVTLFEQLPVIVSREEELTSVEVCVVAVQARIAGGAGCLDVYYSHVSYKATNKSRSVWHLKFNIGRSLIKLKDPLSSRGPEESRLRIPKLPSTLRRGSTTL